MGDDAAQAGFVEGDVGEGAGGVEPGAGLGDGDLGFGGVGVDFGGEVVVGEASGVVLDGARAIETPVVLGNGDGVLSFVGADGLEGGEDALFEFGVGEAVFVTHDVELASQSVAACVHGGSGFAGFGAGAC